MNPPVGIWLRPIPVGGLLTRDLLTRYGWTQDLGIPRARETGQLGLTEYILLTLNCIDGIGLSCSESIVTCRIQSDRQRQSPGFRKEEP